LDTWGAISEQLPGIGVPLGRVVAETIQKPYDWAMPKLEFGYKNGDMPPEHGGGKSAFLSTDEFQAFDESIIGLGDLSQGRNLPESLVAVFDLEGFTRFAVQPDPHIVVPPFLRAFLRWLVHCIRDGATHAKSDGKTFLWCPLPIYMKFLGDGLLVIWDVERIPDNIRENIVSTLVDAVNKYQSEFRAAHGQPTPHIIWLGSNSPAVGLSSRRSKRSITLPAGIFRSHTSSNATGKRHF
jgi:hypothetical protein